MKRLKVWTEFKPYPRADIHEFARQKIIRLVVTERGPQRITGVAPYYAQFDGCEVKDGAILRAEFGDGQTPEEAIRDYCERISGTMLVFRAMTRQRCEFPAPILFLRESEAR